MQKAVKLESLSRNPADGCELPRQEQKEIHPLDDEQATTLMGAAKGGRFGAAGYCGVIHRTYGHFTERMKQDSAVHREGFMKGFLGL